MRYILRCGTGAIGLALLKQLPTVECVGLDVSSVAVDLSTLNARELGLDGRYIYISIYVPIYMICASIYMHACIHTYM